MFIHVFLPTLLLAFLITFVTTPIVRHLGIRLGVIAHMNERTVHTKPIVRMGGLAIFLGFVFSILINLELNNQLIGILLGATAITSIGLLDDIFSLNPYLKFGGQIGAAAIPYFFNIGIFFITNPFGGVIPLGWWSLPVTIIWLVGIMNTINLIDGLDGLASGLTAISSFVLMLVALYTGQYPAAILSLALLGSNLAFLRYNFSPADIFMGDSGSLFLGYMLGLCAIIGVLKSTTTLALAVPILILGIPISDTALAIIRRVRNGKGIFQADKQHIHHKLLNIGLNHKQVVLVCYFISLILGIMAFILSILTTPIAAIVFGLTMVIVTAIFFALRKRFKAMMSYLFML